MIEFLVLICMILSIIALINSSNVSGRLSIKIRELEKELTKLHWQLRELQGMKGVEHQAAHPNQAQPVGSPSDEAAPAIPIEDIPIESKSTKLAPLPQPIINNTLDTLLPQNFVPLAEKDQSSSESKLPDNHESPQESTRPKAATQAESAKPRQRTSGELEALIGGKLLNRIGALAMIIAVGFFLKFAFDNNWINEWARVSMGGAFGVGMLFLAGYFHRKDLTVFSQGIVGVGVSSLYLSVYAAYNFYQLMPQLAAFVLMMAVTVIAFLQALKYDSLAAAIMATAGGFLTPLLLPSAHPNEAGLFTYLALLDVGILILVVAKERWTILEQLARIATYLIYFSWFDGYYDTSVMALTLFHLTLFWALFFAGEFYKLYTQKLNNRLWLVLGSVMNVTSFFIGLMIIIDGPYHEYSGWVTLTLGAVYFGAYQLLNKQGKANTTLEIHYLLSAIFLLIIATALQFKQYDLVAYWSIQAGILIWCGVRWRMRFVIITAVLLYGAVFIQLLFCSTFPTYDYTSYYHFVVNDRSLGMWACILSLFCASLFARTLPDNSFKTLCSYGLTYGWIAMLFAWLSVETNDYFGMYINYNNAVEVWTRAHYTLEMAFGYVWAGYGLLLFLGAWWRKSRIVLIASIFMTLIACIAVSMNSAIYSPILDFVPILNIRAGLIGCMLLVLSVQLYILKKDNLLHGHAISAYGIVLLLLVFELLSVETYAYYEHQIMVFYKLTGANYYDSNYMIALSNTRQLMLSVVWLLYSILMMVVGFWRKKRGLRLASITLSGMVILKVFIFDLHFLTLLNRIISFFGLGVILLLTSYIYQRYKHILLSEEPKQGDNQPQEK